MEIIKSNLLAPMGNDTIVSLFLSSSEKYKDKTAFFYFDNEWKSLTYGKFLTYTRGISSYLIKAGISGGERVAITSANRFEWCASYLGILMAGGTAVPIDAQLSPPEISNLLAHSEAATVFYSNKTAQNISASARTINFDSPGFKETLNYPAIEHFPAISEDDIASIIYTSGTTGIPKGVALSHKNFCSDADAVIKANIVTHEDNVLSLLPLHHTYPFMCTFLVPVLLGASITYPIGMKGPELLSTIREKGITILVGVPQLLELMRNGIIRKIREKPPIVSLALMTLLKACNRLRRILNINMGRAIFGKVHESFGNGFRFFASGGARLDPRVMEDLEALGFTVLEGYGLTETSPVVTFNPMGKRKPGSAGKPLPSVDIKIISPSGTGEGEIAIKGPMVMKGYYKNPTATSGVMKDEWFLSGDLGYMDEEGYLFITGRTKEVIVLSSGKNVYPEEVERKYLKIPLVREICVTGIEERGVVDSLHGIIVPDLDYAKKERIGNIHENLRWAISGVSSTLPSYIRLKGFSIATEPLPRTPLGKLRRFLVKDRLKTSKPEAEKTARHDGALLSDETGKTIAECITPLLRGERPISLSDNLELDLGLDSLQRLELIVSIEKAFSIKLPDEFASEVQTVEDLVLKVSEFGSIRISGTESASFLKSILALEPPEEERKKIGLQHGIIKRAISVTGMIILRLIFKLLFKLEVIGMENLPETPFIIAPNHCSNMDGFVVGVSVPLDTFRKLYFQGFQNYFTGWLSSLFAELAHVIPIDTGTFLSKALQISSYVLRSNRALCIFPEGGRSIDGNLMEFRKGIGILAIEHNLPVVPALIEGTFTALPRGARRPRFTKIRITFGSPLYPSEIDLSKKPERVDDYQFFADTVRERVNKLI